MNLFERFDVNIWASRLLVTGVCALSLAVWAAEEEDPFLMRRNSWSPSQIPLL